MEKNRRIILKASEIILVNTGFHFRFNREKIAHSFSFLFLMMVDLFGFFFFFFKLSRCGLQRIYIKVIGGFPKEACLPEDKNLFMIRFA